MNHFFYDIPLCHFASNGFLIIADDTFSIRLKRSATYTLKFRISLSNISVWTADLIVCYNAINYYNYKLSNYYYYTCGIVILLLVRCWWSLLQNKKFLRTECPPSPNEVFPRFNSASNFFPLFFLFFFLKSD